MDSPFSAIEFTDGKVAFDGMTRGDGSEPAAYVFRIELNNRKPLYGEWNALFKDDELKTFNFEIISFGYAAKDNVNNPHPRARSQFSDTEKITIENLIKDFIGAKSEKNDFTMFPVKRSKFLGSIVFRDGWISVK